MLHHLSQMPRGISKVHRHRYRHLPLFRQLRLGRKIPYAAPASASRSCLVSQCTTVGDPRPEEVTRSDLVLEKRTGLGLTLTQLFTWIYLHPPSTSSISLSSVSHSALLAHCSAQTSDLLSSVCQPRDFTDRSGKAPSWGRTSTLLLLHIKVKFRANI